MYNTPIIIEKVYRAPFSKACENYVSEDLPNVKFTWSFRVKGGTGRGFFTTELLPSSRILSCYLLFDINVKYI